MKNGDEIILLKECESVPSEDEIGFIFVILLDYTTIVKHESLNQKVLEDINKSRKELIKI